MEIFKEERGLQVLLLFLFVVLILSIIAVSSIGGEGQVETKNEVPQGCVVGTAIGIFKDSSTGNTVVQYELNCL